MPSATPAKRVAKAAKAPTKRVSSAVQMKAKKKVTSTTEWKQRQGMPLDVPSGNVCLVRPVGMQVFLQKGIIPNSLRGIITQALAEGKVPSLQMRDVSEEQIADMLQTFDVVTCYCVIEPKVQPVPLDDDGGMVPYEDRDLELLYVDEVDMDDKMFIFQFAVGGTRDVEKFRAEQAARLESLSGQQNLGS